MKIVQSKGQRCCLELNNEVKMSWNDVVVVSNEEMPHFYISSKHLLEADFEFDCKKNKDGTINVYVGFEGFLLNGKKRMQIYSCKFNEKKRQNEKKRKHKRKQCAQCGKKKNKKKGTKLFMCKQCKRIRYCGRHCQKKSWNRGGHKQLCIKQTKKLNSK